jgi:hypothetical protein
MSLISLDSFIDNWTELSITLSILVMSEVVRRYDLNDDFRNFIRLVREGSKADKTVAKKGSPWHVGDWIVPPYSPYLVNVLKKAVEKGRLVEERRSGCEWK